VARYADLVAGGDFATYTPGGGPLNAPRGGGELAAYEHIEGLCGEEDALLRIPHEQREPHHHERLQRVEDELDRAYEHLRRRADKRQS
jgi:hypothetical protein